MIGKDRKEVSQHSQRFASTSEYLFEAICLLDNLTESNKNRAFNLILNSSKDFEGISKDFIILVICSFASLGFK